MDSGTDVFSDEEIEQLSKSAALPRKLRSTIGSSATGRCYCSLLVDDEKNALDFLAPCCSSAAELGYAGKLYWISTAWFFSTVFMRAEGKGRPSVAESLRCKEAARACAAAQPEGSTDPFDGTCGARLAYCFRLHRGNFWAWPGLVQTGQALGS